MSSQESREARQKRIARQTQGAQDVINYRRKDERKEYVPPVVKDDRWSEDYTGEEPHDEDYYLDGEHELNFEEDDRHE